MGRVFFRRRFQITFTFQTRLVQQANWLTYASLELLPDLSSDSYSACRTTAVSPLVTACFPSWSAGILALASVCTWTNRSYSCKSPINGFATSKIVIEWNAINGKQCPLSISDEWMNQLLPTISTTPSTPVCKTASQPRGRIPMTRI